MSTACEMDGIKGRQLALFPLMGLLFVRHLQQFMGIAYVAIEVPQRDHDAFRRLALAHCAGTVSGADF